MSAAPFRSSASRSRAFFFGAWVASVASFAGACSVLSTTDGLGGGSTGGAGGPSGGSAGSGATSGAGGQGGQSGQGQPGGAGGAGQGGAGQGGGGGATPPEDMVLIEAGTFSFEAEGSSIDAAIPSPFYIDLHEVTVARFQRWLDAGALPPCGGAACSVDADGPYAPAMVWQVQWSSFLASSAYADPQQCTNAGDANDAAPTFGAGDEAFPITCVNWYQAAAFCASEGKRLPTETEWQYVASGRGEGRVYPWGFTSPAGCERALWRNTAEGPSFNGCGFPKPVGSAPKGASRDGVFDMAGSVYEWVWDTYAPYPSSPTSSYAGPASSLTPEDKVLRGGGYTWGEFSLHTNDRSHLISTDIHADIGIRCAKSP